VHEGTPLNTFPNATMLRAEVLGSVHGTTALLMFALLHKQPLISRTGHSTGVAQGRNDWVGK
jgi:hypothetical protein